MMMLQEFTDRTGFTPSESEWETINEAYMLSLLDKDPFCRLWKKLNAGRILKERAKKEYKEKLEAKMLRLKFRVKDKAISEWRDTVKENVKFYLLDTEMPGFVDRVLSLRKGERMEWNCACGGHIGVYYR